MKIASFSNSISTIITQRIPIALRRIVATNVKDQCTSVVAIGQKLKNEIQNLKTKIRLQSANCPNFAMS